MENSAHYKEIQKDFDREASKSSGMFSKEWTYADHRIYDYLKEIVKPDWLVGELACGMCNVLQTLDCYQYGVDISEKMLEKCGIEKKKKGSFDDTGYPDDFFDLVFIAFGLQQSENPRTTIEEALRILKNGGQFIVFDGDRSSSTGVEREKRIAEGTWESCGRAVWFEPEFFTELGFEVDHILPHVLVAKKQKIA